MVKLNIGSGRRPKKGYVNVDIGPQYEPELVRDITRGLPYHDGEIDEILCEHIMEHFDTEDFVFLMNEFHRVLRTKGKLLIRSPHQSHITAWIDPGHKRYFIERSFDLFTFPSHNAFDAGITHFYKYLDIKVVDGELRVDLEKVEDDKLKEYVEEMTKQEEKNGGQECKKK